MSRRGARPCRSPQGGGPGCPARRPRAPGRRAEVRGAVADVDQVGPGVGAQVPALAVVAGPPDPGAVGGQHGPAAVRDPQPVGQHLQARIVRRRQEGLDDLHETAGDQAQGNAPRVQAVVELPEPRAQLYDRAQVLERPGPGQEEQVHLRLQLADLGQLRVVLDGAPSRSVGPGPAEAVQQQHQGVLEGHGAVEIAEHHHRRALYHRAVLRHGRRAPPV
jgi:hypothetical protein